MMGGLTITTEEQAKRYTAMLKESVQVGQHVEESPCLPESHPQWQQAVAAGRECPRVDLHRDDAISYELLLYQVAEPTRGMFDTKFRLMVGHLPEDEQLAILDRAAAGLTSPVLIKRLYPNPEPRKD